MIVFFMTTIMHAAFAENLLRNGDFREMENDGLPADWFSDAYIQESGYTVFSVQEGDPKHPIAVSIRNIGENDARFAQTVPVEPESLYLLSGYIRADGVEGGHGANLSIEGVYAFSDEYFETADEWVYIEYYGETGPEQKEITVFARLGGYSGMSTGEAAFADLSLTKVDQVPGSEIADLWYRESSSSDIDEDYAEEDEETTGSSFRLPLTVIIVIYSAAALWMIWYLQDRRRKQPSEIRISSWHVALVLLAGLILRMIISWLVEGYMVDVNCFLSWGGTMASAGPARFYEATSFCDYPPLYTYVLAVNSTVSGLFGNETGISRIVFRFVPSVCDLIACWLLYRLLRREGKTGGTVSFIAMAVMAFNPATILNSAAWGQMDSVLCLLLLATALSAVKGNWKTALPLYVVAVLVKPQALMLGPLGLAYIIISFVRIPENRRPIIIGTGISILVLAAGIIPFSVNQDWDWLIGLYGRTLASYPYATVNTANIYYLVGGNWAPVGHSAHVLIPCLFALACAVYGFVWHRRASKLPVHFAEVLICLAFSAAFVVCAALKASWAWVGGLAMAFAFVVVLSPAVRSGNIRMLPWLGGLLFILLYVFGVKMHERYLFPAILLLAAAWGCLKDRRILYILILFTATVFMNEGIVLDNSIRLGSQLGHLNSDTVWLADIVSVLNVTGALYAVWLGLDLFLQDRKQPGTEKGILCRAERKYDRKLYWSRKDTAIVLAVTAVYSVISLLTLGSTKAPQTCWTSSSAAEEIIFDLGEEKENIEILYFAQVSRNDFTFASSTDGETWTDETWAQMDQGQCWKWKYVTQYYEKDDGERSYFNSDESHIIRFSGRYIRLTACQLGLKLNEVLFRNEDGEVLEAQIKEVNGSVYESELYSDPSALLDEQDTIEGMPSFPGSADSEHQKIQPSWWNSTYFDEIYFARTAHEFLEGSVPYETTHPPLGKVLTSFSVAVFGMTPFGWRFAGALAGILMLPGIYLLGKQLTKRTWMSALACLFMALDCQHLTQTQLSTIDSFPVLFIIFAYFFMLRFIQTDYRREKASVSLIPLAFSGLFMGLSIASKWIGIYAGAGLAVLFFWHCIRIIRAEGSVRIQNDDLSDGQEQKGAKVLRRTMIICLWCILFFVIVPVAVYLLSYIPYMAYNARRIHSFTDYLSEVWRSQVGMFSYHNTPNLGMDHPFYSPWWEWPVIGKPMYYASQQYIPADSPVHHSIFCFGNPVIWFGGLAAIAFCFFRALLDRRYIIRECDYVWHLTPATGDQRFAFILTGLLAQYLPWVLVPRGTYIYHYFASIPFLILMITICFDGEGKRTDRTGKILAGIFAVAAAVFFVLLFPYACGLNVPTGWLEIGRRILRIWY